MKTIIATFVFYSLLAYNPSSHRLPVRLHSHNDEMQSKPLYKALAHGFSSIEADFFDIWGSIVVGHNYLQLDRTKTLEDVYLKPLDAIIKRRGGVVYRVSKIIGKGHPLYIVLDCKIDSQILAGNVEATYNRLESLILKYKQMATRWKNDSVEPAALAFVQSGICPSVEFLLAKKEWWIALDCGGLSTDAGLRHNRYLYPLVSFELPKPVNYSWLRGITTKAHDKGQLVRVWDNAQDRKTVFSLWDAGVDLVSID